MRCRAVRHLLPLYAGRDLPGALARCVERHVASCAECAREARAFEADRGRLEALSAARREGDPLGENFWYAIRRELRSDPASPLGRREAGGRALGWGATLARAAAVAATVGLAFVLYGRPRELGGRGPSVPALREARGAREGTVAAIGTRGAAVPAARPFLRQPQPEGGMERVFFAPLAIEESQPLAAPGLEYHIETWRAGEDEELSF
jgi:hypothetical protein